MKLAFCLFKYFPYGGLQRDFLRIAKACVARGHEVHVFTMHWEGPLPADLTLHLIKIAGWQNHTRSERFAKEVGRQLETGEFDRVVGFNKMPHLDLYYAADVCYAARIAVQRGWLSHLSPRYKQLKLFEQAVFGQGQSTQIMMISALQQPEFIRFYQTELERFHLLPPGIAKDRIAPANATEIRLAQRATFQIRDDEFLVLMVGSGFKTKGVDRAILAVAQLPIEIQQKTKLYIIGQDDPWAFQALAKAKNIADRVIFLGGRADIPEFLLAADLLIHPAYHENTGTVLLEALVAGLPVLTVDACGYAHFIEEANAGCVLTSPFSQEKLTQTLAFMLTASQKKQWKENAIAYAKTTDLYSMPEKAADLIENSQPSFKNKSFASMMALSGEVFRNLEGRKTQRVFLNGQSYFLKQHHGVGWREIIKNISQGRWPILGAKNEWLAINALERLGISVPKAVAFAQRGVNPAQLKSYILLEELTPTISLEELANDWSTKPPQRKLKLKLLDEVAHIARTIHVNGINHRDFYICHFLLSIPKGKNQIDLDNIKLSLIDLHRAQVRTKTPIRWQIKDLAGLYFSSKEIGLTQRDLLRFIKKYRQQPLRVIMQNEKDFWKKVIDRGEKLYRDHQ